MKRRFLISLTVLLCVISALAVFAGCKPPETEKPVAGEEVGKYYCDADGQKYTLELTDECKYVLVMGDTTLEGEYVPDGETVTWSL